MAHQLPVLDPRCSQSERISGIRLVSPRARKLEEVRLGLRLCGRAVAAALVGVVVVEVGRMKVGIIGEDNGLLDEGYAFLLPRGKGGGHFIRWGLIK